MYIQHLFTQGDWSKVIIVYLNSFTRQRQIFGNVPGRCCLELLLLVIQWCLVHSGRISPTQIVMLVLLELPVYTINKAETVGYRLAPVWTWELTVAIGTGWPCFRQFGQSLSQNSNGPLRLPIAGIHFVSVFLCWSTNNHLLSCQLRCCSVTTLGTSS